MSKTKETNVAKYIVVVESPAKTKTLEKHLGKSFKAFASFGHVADLRAKEGAVDTDHDFAMHYEPIDRNARHVDAIATAMKRADALYLATDPDREGEAIAWHVQNLLTKKKVLKDKPVYRVAFNEITKNAVQEAIANPRELSMDLVHAQQARRALDYLVGFNLSPLLWKKVQRGLSAGRVQSPALRMIVERELEIEAFKPQEYWTHLADVSADNQTVSARLVQFEGQKVEQFTFTTEKEAHAVQSSLESAASAGIEVVNVERKQRKRQPAAPFITSTLQQEAVRKLGFTAKRVMRTAQQLYEGIDLGEDGSVGLITYMRTDSVHLSNEAIENIRAYLTQHYDSSLVPDAPRAFKTKSKNAQEAHEAIRPSDVFRTPTALKRHLSDDQYKLYRLIWLRTLACQMQHATIDTVAVDLGCGENHAHVFRANGSVITHPGFLKVYQDEQSELITAEERFLPPLQKGDTVDLNAITAHQHFTEPPPRYTEASLVKQLESHGIGRPSTYASIISTLQDRGYVNLDQKRFIPTDVGRIVNRFLTQYFPKYVDFDFTATLEDQLDHVSRGETEWVPLLREFWVPFKTEIGRIDETVKRQDVTHEATDEKCPECSKPLSIRLGRRGRFIGCDGFPDCTYTRSLNETSEQKEAAAKKVEGRSCPQCQQDLVVRHGPYGAFIGCSQYPKCRYIESLNQDNNTGVRCPDCHRGTMLKKQSRKGKLFFACSEYPKCEYATWNEPCEERCPDCGWPMLTIKVTKRRGREKLCPQKNCGYSVKAPEEASSE